MRWTSPCITTATPKTHADLLNLSTTSAETDKAWLQTIGLAMADEDDLGLNRSLSAGMLVYGQGIRAADRVPLLVARKRFSENFPEWFLRHQPEAVLSRVSQCIGMMQNVGCRVLEDLDFIHLALTADDEPMARGIRTANWSAQR